MFTTCVTEVTYHRIFTNFQPVLLKYISHIIYYSDIRFSVEAGFVAMA